jgi:hypothetical protein
MFTVHFRCGHLMLRKSKSLQKAGALKYGRNFLKKLKAFLYRKL